MKNKAKLLLGYYGAGNFGDELILKQYLKKNKHERYIVFSYGYDYTQNNVIKTYHWKQGDKLSNFKNFLSAIKKVDEVLWVGGTCFTDEDGDGAFKFMLIAKLFLKKLKYINIGINELKERNRKIKTKIILTLANYISVRDQQSYELAKYYKFNFINKYNLNSDIEQDLGEQYLENIKCSESNEKNLLIAWRVLTNYVDDETELINSLVKYIIKVKDKFDNIYIINTDSTKDKKTSEKIYQNLSQLKNINYLPELSTDEKINYVCKSSFIITARLHIGVMGSLLNKNTYVYNYSNKIEYYFNNHKNTYKIFKQFNDVI